MPANLKVRGVSAQYHNVETGILAVLANVSFSIMPGQFVCLVGPSGCGKSTLVRIIAGLQPPARGTVLIDDEPVKGPARQVAIMFQDANLMPWRSVIDNVALPLEIDGQPRHERYAAARALLPRLGLTGFEKAYPGELSGGMAQRVALGRVLIQQPALLLLDEPFGALDAMTREQVSADLLRAWEQGGQTILMITHDINEAVWLADRVMVMSQRPGRIISDVLVDLPRPRTLEMIYSPRFGAIAAQVRGLIERPH